MISVCLPGVDLVVFYPLATADSEAKPSDGRRDEVGFGHCLYVRPYPRELLAFDQ